NVNRSRLVAILTLVIAGCGTGSGPGSPAVFGPTPARITPAAATADPSPTSVPTAVASVEPSRAVTPPPPSVAPAAVLAGITKADVTRIAANTGQVCVIDALTIECQNGSQSKGIQARRAEDAVAFVAVTANTYSTDSIGYAYLKKVCPLLGSYAPAVIGWIGAHRGQTVSKQFGPYRIDYTGPLGRAIIGIRPSS
ncbi:MAG TPA: hypothetical protein VGQ85_09815, partial [Candidatus Limnocylindrales bacterium]|nr:hypothetical protein [Candidatus Limnocylindrales bacterium]